jgi:Ran GTPase-activating protein (RanGAP) involved in mRNA processing and transport
MYSSAASAVVTQVAPFIAALEAVPAVDWCRTWPADRTIMVKMTSKRVGEAVVKICPPAVFSLHRSLWNNSRNRTVDAKLKLVMRQLLSLVTNCRITTLKLEWCNIERKIQELEEVLYQCPELNKLDLGGNDFADVSIVDALMQYTVSLQSNSAVCGLTSLNLECCNICNYGTARVANTLSQLSALSCLNLECNGISNNGATSLAQKLPEGRALTALNLNRNFIGVAGAESLAQNLRQCSALTRLQLGSNEISDGAASIAEILPQCSTLTELDLSANYINSEGAECLAQNLPQCVALAHFDLSCNWIGPTGAGSIAGVLGQCTSLTRLNLNNNQIESAGAERLERVLRITPALYCTYSS